jgi:hypothetical protein
MTPPSSLSLASRGEGSGRVQDWRNLPANGNGNLAQDSRAGLASAPSLRISRGIGAPVASPARLAARIVMEEAHLQHQTCMRAGEIRASRSLGRTHLDLFPRPGLLRISSCPEDISPCYAG